MRKQNNKTPLLQKIIPSLTLMVWVLLVSLQALAQSPGADLAQNRLLLQEMTSKLKIHLVREDGLPVYEEIFKKWLQEKVPLLEQNAEKSTADFTRQISQEVHSLKMSHLNFYRLADGHLGFEATEDKDHNFYVTQVYSHGPADKHGVQVGDQVLNIDGWPVKEQLAKTAPEQSRAEVLFLRAGATVPYSASITRVPKNSLMKGLMGITTKTLEDGTIVVEGFVRNSAGKKAGLKLGDLILKIDGQNPRQRLTQGTSAEVTLPFLVQRKDGGQTEEVPLTFQSLADQNRSQYSVIEKDGKKAVYLSIPNFSKGYDPVAVHEAMEKAQEYGMVMVDLRGNGGGRSEHFLSFLLQPETDLCHQVGMKFLPRQKLLGLMFATTVTKISNQSLQMLINLSKKTGTFDKDLFLSAMETWKERIVGQTRGYHGLPAATNEILNKRLGELAGMLETSAETCAQQTAQSTPSVLKLTLSQKVSANFKIEKIIEEWQKNTFVELKELWNKKKIQSVICQIPETREIESWRHLENHWGKFPTKNSFPYTGKVAFVVNNQTWCAAESCALIPLEYQDLRKQGIIDGIKYKDQLTASEVRVFGTTQGGAQGMGGTVLDTSHGHYNVGFPVYDLFTPVHGRRIEGQGIQTSMTGEVETLPSTETSISTSTTAHAKEDDEIFPATLMQKIWNWSSAL